MIIKEGVRLFGRQVERTHHDPKDFCAHYGGLQATYFHDIATLAVPPIPIAQIIYIDGKMRVLMSERGEPFTIRTFEEYSQNLQAVASSMQKLCDILVMADPLKDDYAPLPLKPTEYDLSCLEAQREGAREANVLLKFMVPLSWPTPADIYGVLNTKL